MGPRGDAGQGGGGGIAPETWVNVRWWSGGGATVFRGGGVWVVSDDTTTALHLRERERKVRGGLNRWKEARPSGSLRGRTVAASQRKPKRSDGLQQPRQVGRV
jgi:hypothetical protein